MAHEQGTDAPAGGSAKTKCSKYFSLSQNHARGSSFGTTHENEKRKMSVSLFLVLPYVLLRGYLGTPITYKYSQPIPTAVVTASREVTPRLCTIHQKCCIQIRVSVL